MIINSLEILVYIEILVYNGTVNVYEYTVLLNLVTYHVVSSPTWPTTASTAVACDAGRSKNNSMARSPPWYGTVRSGRCAQ
jgi:hypothetical protein